MMRPVGEEMPGHHGTGHRGTDSATRLVMGEEGARYMDCWF